MAPEVEWSVRVDDPHPALGRMTYACTLVTNLGSYADAGAPISARRRYNEFVDLRAALAERVVAARAQAFEALLAAVGKDDKLRVMPLVAAFLGASPYPARAVEVLSEEVALEEGALGACVSAVVPSAQPLFQSAEDDPTGGERDTTGRQAALQSVLCAAVPPVGERATSKGSADAMSAVDAAVAPIMAVCGADAPLTSDVQAAAAAELHRASVEQAEQAAAHAGLTAAKAAQQAAKAAAGQAAVEAAAAAQREAEAAAPVTTAREEDAPVLTQPAAQRSQTAEAEEEKPAEPAEPAPAVETLAADALEPEADASQGGDQAEVEAGSAVVPLGDPLSAPPPPKLKKPKAKKQSAKQ